MAKFRTRARAVDMLGRQQIAGIPTAISELFKNAHDAYADNVQVDYFRSDGLFVLRDNGVGMTKEDFENRWLTIGTESKLEGQTNLKRNYVPPDKPERPVMGEKGIGRLAIAIIGRQVLVLSRAVRKDGLQDLVAAFIHWNIFALPGIDIEEIEIPVRVFNGGTLPSVDDVLSMIDVVRQNVLALADKISENERNIILSDLESFKINPSSLESFAEGPYLSGDGAGTHFYIFPSDETISIDIDKDRQVNDDPVFAKFLVGFTNTMISDPTTLPMTVAFKDWRTDRKGDFQELIGPEAFITPEEFKKSDHHFIGSFDEFGQFSGNVRIYGKDSVEHVVPWSNNGGRKTLCGPFRIHLACLQGKQNQSVLSPELYAEIDNKLSRYGGMYIYRDGIRILPYGNYEHDFLEVEKRRNKGAGYYYFSYRKMAGGYWARIVL